MSWGREHKDCGPERETHTGGEIVTWHKGKKAPKAMQKSHTSTPFSRLCIPFPLTLSILCILWSTAERFRWSGQQRERDRVKAVWQISLVGCRDWRLGGGKSVDLHWISAQWSALINEHSGQKEALKIPALVHAWKETMNEKQKKDWSKQSNTLKAADSRGNHTDAKILYPLS